MIDPEFLAILRCPLHPDGPVMGAETVGEDSFLTCGVCGKKYPVVDNIPHLLPEDGIDPATEGDNE